MVSLRCWPQCHRSLNKTCVPPFHHPGTRNPGDLNYKCLLNAEFICECVAHALFYRFA